MGVKRISNRAIVNWLKKNVDDLEETIMGLKESLQEPKQHPSLQRLNSLEESVEENTDSKFLIKECARITKTIFEDFLNMSNLPEARIGGSFLSHCDVWSELLDYLFPCFEKRARSFYHPPTRKIVIKSYGMHGLELLNSIRREIIHEYCHYLHYVLPARKGGRMFIEGFATSLTDTLYSGGLLSPFALGHVYKTICSKIKKQPKIDNKIDVKECVDGKERIVSYSLSPKYKPDVYDWGKAYFTLLQKKYGKELYRRILEGDKFLNLLP